VPIPQALYDELRALAAKNPTDSDFIFFDALSEKKPFSRKMIEGAFIRQLAKIGIDAAGRSRRRLSFHSLRHGFNASMRGSIPDATLRKATGHLTASMTDHYDHTTNADLEAIRAAQDSRILFDFQAPTG
jgi:integrase